MDRDEFMELVYETFADEPDNVLANGIIEAADAYAEHEKAQLSHESTTYDLISKFIDGLEEIFADIRERHVDDSVCGLCEYDGAYMGQSGDWCNECPGFNRDDCFKLSDKTRKKWTNEIIKALPTIQQELTDEQAIAHLQSSGWMQRHDKEMYESGLREQLADDSDSYDSLLPNVQSDLIEKIQVGITATNSNDAYSLGMRNGMRWCKSLIDGVEPKFEGMEGATT